MTTAKERREAITVAIPTARAPERLTEWLRQEIKAKASRFELGQWSGVVGGALAVAIQSYEPGELNEADELAHAIFARAREENEACPLVGANAYQVTCFRASAPTAVGSLRFKVVPSDGSTVGMEGPDALGVIRQTMRHMEEREASQQAILLEGVSAIHTGRNESTLAWKELVQGYKELNDHTRTAAAAMMETLTKEKERLERSNARHEERGFESAILFESLVSEKHRRDLETAKLTRKEDRTDKLFDDIVVAKVLPALAMRFGLPMGPIKGAGAPPATKAVDTNGAAPPVAPPPEFTKEELKAIGELLGSLGLDDFAKIGQVVNDTAKEKLAALIDTFRQSGERAEAAAAAAHANGAATNGAAKGGAPPS